MSLRGGCSIVTGVLQGLKILAEARDIRLNTRLIVIAPDLSHPAMR